MDTNELDTGQKELFEKYLELQKKFAPNDTEATLPESEQRFRKLIEHAPDAVFVLESASGRVIDCNRQACTALGYSREELLQLSAPDMECKLSPEEVRAIHERVTPAETITVEGFHRRKDGTTFPVEIRIGILRSAEPRLLISIVRDITMRRQTEEAIRRSREQYKTLVENVGLGVMLISADFRILAINSQQARLFKKPADGFIGKECFREFEKREAPCPHCPGVPAMATGLPAEVEARGKRDDGSGTLVRVQAFPVLNPDGGPVTSFIEVVEDISERKKVEQERSSLQAQLIQSSKMAAIGRLASGVAHEINNPLTIILGLSQLLAKKAENDPSLQADMKEIETAAVRCRNIVSSLLAYARNENDAFSTLNVNDAIEKSIGLVGHQMELNKVKIQKQLDASLPSITGNTHQLIQVFINLMTNAADAMPGGGTLYISSERAGDRLLVRFADTGQGIPAGMLKEILDPFFTTKPVGKGTGLGLSISARIIENHKGTIQIESEVGKGTIFTLSFPVGLPDKA
jgi:PAS domain S-box-containing protein